MRFVPFVSSLALLAASLGSAHAQATFSLTGPADTVSVREAPQSVLRGLGATRDRLLFTGEVASRSLPVYVAPSEVGQSTRLQLTLLSAISTNPERSRIAVTLNGVALGERRLEAFGEPERVFFDVPAGALAPGLNELRLDATHAHRVDCTLEASYELWTQVVPEGSGFVLAGMSTLPSDLDALAGAAGPDGRTRLRLPSAAATGEAASRHARVVQAAVLAGAVPDPLVAFGAEDGPGIDVVVATEAELPGLGAAVPPGRGPRVALSAEEGAGRLKLVVTGSDSAELEAAIGLFVRSARSHRPEGTREGLAALDRRGLRVEGGETVSLADLGVVGTPFSGRYFAAETSVVLPADFYPGSYDRMTLSLDAAYAPGLAAGSGLYVRVNGSVVASVPLSNPRGAVVRDRDVHLPLSAFKPGPNSIEIEAHTLTTADEACSPDALSSDRRRFVLLPTGTLRVPALARIGSLPNIAGAMAGVLAMTGDGAPLDVYTPAGEGEAVAAALTLLARTARDTNSVVDVRLVHTDPAGASGHALVVGSLGRLTDAVLAKAGLKPADVRRAWSGADVPPPVRSAPSASLDRAVRVASVGPLVLDLSGEGGARDENAAASALPELAVPSLQPDALLDTASDFARGAFATLADRVVAMGTGEPRAAEGRLVIDPASRLLVAQGVEGAAPWAGAGSGTASLLPPASSITLVTAPAVTTMARDLGDLLGGRGMRHLTGQAATFVPESHLVAARLAPDDVLVETQPFTVGNARLILAGWLSRNTPVFVGVLAVLALACAAFVYAGVRLSGAREA